MAGPASTESGASSSSVPTVTVSVQFLGGSDNILVASNPPGISCSPLIPGATACTAAFPRGTPVELRAASTLCGIHFEGACAGVTSCFLEGGSDASVTVAVERRCPLPPVAPLSVSVSGRGRVTLGTVPIDCGRTCTASVVPGKEVVLVAIPEPGATFLGWSGACSGILDCRFLAGSGATQVNAAFSR